MYLDNPILVRILETRIFCDTISMLQLSSSTIDSIKIKGELSVQFTNYNANIKITSSIVK